jgi:hypothetical protein
MSHLQLQLTYTYYTSPCSYIRALPLLSQQAPARMLCNICSRINLDELVSEERMKHHKIFIDLFNAAKAGCPLCEAVFEDHEGSYQSDEEDHEANF